jgi:hypothetical protein
VLARLLAPVVPSKGRGRSKASHSDRP